VRAALTSSYYYLTSQLRQAVANNASRSAHSKTSNATARVKCIISAPYALGVKNTNSNFYKSLQISVYLGQNMRLFQNIS
jgi:hypothetical protein